MVKDVINTYSLSSQQVQERISNNQVNKKAGSKSKSIKKIIFDNTITLFNFLNIFLFLCLLFVNSYKNMLFMGVVLCNTVIGIVQEIRSKKAVDKLSIVVSDKVKVVRDFEVQSISVDEIVIDDLIVLTAGSQVPSDCVVVGGFGCVNESLITGESDLVEKNINSQLISGSFVSSGEIYAKVIHIGKENFASKIQSEATYSKKINSEIMSTLNKILTFCSIIIFPVGIALFVNQYYFNGNSLTDTVVSTVAALIGMIPEGLILLTSSVLAVAVIRLAKKNVLVQQLFCIETLARVDVLCLDKTGTITTGDMEVTDILCNDDDRQYVGKVLKSLAQSSVDNNSTIKAIDDYFNCDFIGAEEVFAFSSEKKWSGAVLSDGKSYVLGAAEFIYKKEQQPELFKQISDIDDVIRVVTLSVSDKPFENKELPKNLKPLAFVLLKDKIRDNASKTIEYFKSQGVKLKVISGDNNRTVERISKSVGIEGAENSIDATELDTDEKLLSAAEKYTVFGRVTPHQKKQLVKALKDNGHTVAMTGDGVNDVLALKEADCSVSIASASDAAKNIAQLVLADNNFSSMPKIVDEGRRSINNIQRSASLFLTKTIYSIILALVFVFIDTEYPFQPIQLSLISAFTIGLPSFVLALEPNHDIVRGKFLRTVILNSLPASLIVSANIVFVSFLSSHLTADEISTIAVVITSLVGVMMVIRLSIPFNAIRTALITVIVLGLFIGIVVFHEFFGIVALPFYPTLLLFAMAAGSIILFYVLYKFIDSKNLR